MKKSDILYFQLARDIAIHSDYPRIHVGCIIVYKNKIISTGWNSNSTHPMQKKYNIYRNTEETDNDTFIPKIHAEISALSKIKNKDINMSKVKLYVYRIRKSSDFGMARPCASCMQAIIDAGIKHIFYTTNTGYAEEDIIL